MIPSKPLGAAQPANPPSHISDEVRADLSKLLPEQRANILRVADAPKGK
jgi:hypothetical protein